jgi:uncharacterized membrane protein HdeD (DUF308 family)/energy-coupling factor transporter ATP-binding protein EcfA2
MTTSARLPIYEQRKKDFLFQLGKQEKEIARIAVFRLLAGLAIAACVYLSFKDQWFVAVTLGVTFVFAWLVRLHSKLFNEKVITTHLLQINEHELAAAKGDFSKQETGAAFIDTHHVYAYDLDIFGEGSLFQFINRAATHSGKKQLATRLKNPLASIDDIVRHQESTKELSERIDLRQKLQAVAMNSLETAESRTQLLDWLQHKPMLPNKKAWRVVLMLVPALTIILVVAAYFSPAFKPFASLFVFGQLALIGSYFKRTTAFHDYVSRKHTILKQYAALLKVFNLEKYQSDHLKDLSSVTHEAEVKITKLASLLSAFDARLNFMTNLVVNGLLLYDLQCVYRLEKWREENGESLANWLDALAEIEVTNSLATFTYNHPNYAFPVFSETQHIKAEALGHPLLAENICVSNDFRVGDPQSVLLITGANMAGKSTFLRTLGIAMVLAYNGAPVCAKSFSCSVMHLRTGMRTADSLKDQQSYFYAELNRLKSITEELRTKKPLLILLDEILKGTNSTDKQAGSMALVKQLIDQPCLALVATHDLALGVLEDNFPQQVKNYHFEPTIENDELSFDYQLKEGIAEKMNATFLMKKMGIIPA